MPVPTSLRFALAGETPTRSQPADVAVARCVGPPRICVRKGILNWTNLHDIDLSRWPNLKAYVGRVAARPKVQEAMRAEGLLK